MAYDPFAFVDFTRPDHTGRVILSHEGRKVTIRFPWSVIREMQIDWGLEPVDREDPDANQENLWTFVSDALDKGDIEKLSHMIGYSATLDDETEPMGSQAALKLSLPVQPTRLALRAAWTFAWNGGQTQDDLESVDDDPGKKPGNTSQILSVLRSILRSKPESNGENSGT